MNQQQQDIVAGYAALLELNKRMIEIAVAGEWEDLVEMKSEHLCQVETLMNIEYDVNVNEAFREAKRAVLIQIAASEQELRDRLATIADAPDAGALGDDELSFLAEVAAALAAPGLTAARAEQEPLAVAAALAERLGPLPVALTIAQAAMESDWGQATIAAGTPAVLPCLSSKPGLAIVREVGVARNLQRREW